jgi:hypothetical protein
VRRLALGASRFPGILIVRVTLFKKIPLNPPLLKGELVLAILCLRLWPSPCLICLRRGMNCTAGRV